MICQKKRGNPCYFNIHWKSVCFRLEKEENTENNNSTQTIIIIIVMCVVLALSVLVVVCFVFKRIRRKSQNENKQRGNIILRTQIRLLTALCKILCICHKILHRYIHLMCMATKAYLLGRTLCNTSNRSLKVYTFESERLLILNTH